MIEVVVRGLGEVGRMLKHSVYILKLSNGDYYVGRTDDLDFRIKQHYKGEQRTTKKFLPCKLVTTINFYSKRLAFEFERYLKTGSGLAFRKRHLV